MVSDRHKKLVADMLAKVGPSTSDSLAKRIDGKHSRTRAYLREAKMDGLVDRTGLGALVIWFAPGDKDKAVEMMNSIKAESKQRRRDRARERFPWAVKRARIEQAHEAWAAARPVHRLIPANEAPPIKPLGPTSVFALGGAA